MPRKEKMNPTNCHPVLIVCANTYIEQIIKQPYWEDAWWTTKHTQSCRPCLEICWAGWWSAVVTARCCPRDVVMQMSRVMCSTSIVAQLLSPRTQKCLVLKGFLIYLGRMRHTESQFTSCQSEKFGEKIYMSINSRSPPTRLSKTINHWYLLM